MYQQEINFFWPLTEQLPLELDYTPCEPPKLEVKYDTGITFATYPTTVSPMVTIKADHLTIQTKHMPWYRKLAYKLMGFKWE